MSIRDKWRLFNSHTRIMYNLWNKNSFSSQNHFFKLSEATSRFKQVKFSGATSRFKQVKFSGCSFNFKSYKIIGLFQTVLLDRMVIGVWAVFEDIGFFLSRQNNQTFNSHSFYRFGQDTAMYHSLLDAAQAGNKRPADHQPPHHYLSASPPLQLGVWAEQVAKWARSISGDRFEASVRSLTVTCGCLLRRPVKDLCMVRFFLSCLLWT